MSTPFYAVCNHNKPLAQLYLSTRRAEYAAWLKLIPSLEEDFELVTEQCARHCGQSTNTVTKTLLALQRLTRELPLLYAVLEKHWHLDFPRIVAIDTAMSKLGPNAGKEVIAEIDAKIARYLTPRAQNQQLPTPDRIAQRVRQLVNEFDDRVPVKDPRPQRRMVKNKLTANSSSLAVEAPHDEIQKAEDCIKATATALGISRAEAMLQVLSGDYPAKDAVTTLVLFTAKDIDNAPGYLQGVGWVGPETVEKLREGATVIDADETAHAETASYQPTDAIRTFVEGRDGTCRWPGCNVPAHNCQLDHRHNFAEGGPTSPANLFALCQHHHNIKTDTRAMYIVDPISDVIYWLFEDGSWVSDAAQDGPIGTGAKRWLQTFEQKIAARRKNAQERAHDLADDIDEYYKQRAEADKREQDHRDIIDELWVDDVKLAQALMREANLKGNNPLLANDNVFMLLEAIHKMGIDLDVSDDIAPWARIQKKILEHEREENERRILEEAEKLAQELADKIMKQKEQAEKTEETDEKDDTEQTIKVPTNPEDPPF